MGFLSDIGSTISNAVSDVGSAVGNVVHDIGGVAGSALGGWGGSALAGLIPGVGPFLAPVLGAVGSSVGGQIGNDILGNGQQTTNQPLYNQVGQLINGYYAANAVAPPPGPYGGSYTPPNLSGIANTTTNAINSLSNPLAPYTGQINSQLQSGIPQLQQLGQNVIAQLPGITGAYQNAGNYASNQAGLAASNAQGLTAAGQQVWNTALDPQKALYNRTLNQITQQDNAQQAARGLTMSPVGQELSNQAISNFNIDWQNQQLARQLAGLQGLGSAYGNATNMGVAGSNLMNSAAQNAYLGAAMPVQLGNAALQAPLGLINSAYPLLNAGNVANAAQAGLGMQYMGLGQSGAALGLNAAFGQAGAQANGLNSLGQLGSQVGNGIANAIQGIGNSGASTYYDPNANYYSSPYIWNSPSSTSGFGNNTPTNWNAPTSTSLGSSFSSQLTGGYIPSTPAGLDPTNVYFGGGSSYSPSSFGAY